METVVITGATGGLGLRTAEVLAGRGYHVVLGYRSRARVSAITGFPFEPLELDLADLGSVSRAVAALRDRRVDAVIANGAVQVVSGVRTSKDGYELTFATNHLAHHLLLTSLPLPAGARVVVVSSGTHLGPPKSMGFPAPRWAPAHSLADPAAADPSPTAGRVRYSTSKLANLYLAYELARRRPDLTVTAYDPGLLPDTGLPRDYPAPARALYRLAAPVIAAVVPGARTSTRAARYLADLVTAPRPSGQYVEGPRVGESSPLSHDLANAAALWADSDELIKSTVR